MSEIEPVGHQLVIVTSVFGLVAFAILFVRVVFRIRSRKYDVSDTFLVAAMVCVIPLTNIIKSLTTLTDVRHHPERYPDQSCRCLRIRETKSQHSGRSAQLVMAGNSGLSQSDRLQTHDTSLQTLALLVIPNNVLYIHRSHYTDDQGRHMGHNLPHRTNLFICVRNQRFPMYTNQ